MISDITPFPVTFVNISAAGFTGLLLTLDSLALFVMVPRGRGDACTVMPMEPAPGIVNLTCLLMNRFELGSLQ
jgi:hypothetical protein